jgi:hypothetical protein
MNRNHPPRPKFTDNEQAFGPTDINLKAFLRNENKYDLKYLSIKDTVSKGEYLSTP